MKTTTASHIKINEARSDPKARIIATSKDDCLRMAAILVESGWVFVHRTKWSWWRRKYICRLTKKKTSAP